jgi:hypothetical protein
MLEGISDRIGTGHDEEKSLCAKSEMIVKEVTRR